MEQIFFFKFYQKIKSFIFMVSLLGSSLRNQMKLKLMHILESMYMMRGNLRNLLRTSVEIVAHAGIRKIEWIEKEKIWNCQELENAFTMLSTQKLGQKMTRKYREPGKNINCPAEFSFKISESCASVCKDATNTTHYQKKNIILLK